MRVGGDGNGYNPAMNQQRDLGIDAVRGFAMVLMTSTHALRMFRPDSLPDFAQWLFRIEPVTPAIFFLVAGWGLSRSHRRTTDVPAWRKRQWVRSGILFSISAAVFFAYSGLQWPESIVSTGVLGCLAWTIAIGALILPRTALAIGLLVASVVVRALFDSRGIRVDGLNSGTFALLPNLPIFLAGILGDRLLDRNKSYEAIAGTMGALVILFLSYKIGFRNLWDGDWGIERSTQEYVVTIKHSRNGFAMISDLIQGVPTRPFLARFNTPTLSLLPVLVAMAGLCGQFFSMVTDRFPHRLTALSALGRHGLVYYLAHFAVLGVIAVILPPSLSSQSWTWLVVTFTVAGLGMISMYCFDSRGARS